MFSDKLLLTIQEASVYELWLWRSNAYGGYSSDNDNFFVLPSFYLDGCIMLLITNSDCSIEIEVIV